MRKLISFIFACVTWTVAMADVLPEKPAELSSTRLIGVERLKGGEPNVGPDGLSFCFLVSRTEVARHKLAISETEDFMVAEQSYRAATQAALGKTFAPNTTIHEAAKYVAAHPEAAAALAAAKQSLVVVVEIAGAALTTGSAIEVRLRVGFSRTAGKPEWEELLFRTKVPAK